MKYAPLILVPFALAGCHRSEFDISADQAKRPAPPGAVKIGHPDFNHLPPGAVKHELHFKKGDHLPDGTIADHDITAFQVEFKDAPGQGAKRGMVITQDTTTK